MEPVDGETENQSSFTNNTKQTIVPNGLNHEANPDKLNDDDIKVPKNCTNESKLYDDNKVDDSNEDRVETLNNYNLEKMSPVEGPVNEIPKNLLEKNVFGDQEQTNSSDGCEEFSGQIVYNPDGSAFIIEESDESLLEQIPKQEGSIVERPGKCLTEVEYPRIDQATYIARRKAWYNAVGNAYLQFLQGRRPDSPVVHNFKVVSVKDKLMTAKCDERMLAEEPSEGKCPSNKKF